MVEAVKEDKLGKEPKSRKAMFKPSWLGKRIIVVLVATLITSIAITISQIEPFSAWNQMRLHFFPRQSANHADKMMPVPMGVVDAQPIGTDSSVSTNPVKLLLAATQPGRNAHEGLALIGASALSPQTYSAGALLANGARLQEIYKDSVVLERDGKTEHLYVSGREPAAYQPALASIVSVGGSVPVDAHPDSNDSLTDVIRMSPTYSGNSFSGLQVFANSQSDIFFRLGLQEGDVITAIDGEVLRDQRSAIASLRPLVDGQSITVLIKRGDQVQTIGLNGAVMF